MVGRNNQATMIDADVYHEISALIPLAPNHNPAHLEGIQTYQSSILPEVPQVAVFDTAFHTTIPEFAKVYPLPYKYYQQEFSVMAFMVFPINIVPSVPPKFYNNPWSL